MSSIRNDSMGVEDITTVFKTILHMLGNSLHFTELSQHLLLYYAGEKSFFHSYNDHEKYSFFRKSKFFIINSDGYVSFVEDEIIMAFRKILECSGPQHVLTLINSIHVASTFFSQSCDSEVDKFFKDHAQYFSIQNNDYVKLSQTNDVVRKTFFDGQETALLKFLMCNLQSCGPMYIFWLADCLRNSVYYVDVPCLWKFLKEHCDSFIISDDAFVDLSPHLKSKVKADSIISQKEDEVIGFFVAKLAVYDCLLYTVLLKKLQNSALDIKCFFAKYSLKDVQGFFKKHSNVFVLHGKHVSLSHNISLEGYETFNGTKYPVEDVTEVAFFFLYCLKVKCPKHFNDFSVMLEESNIETDFKYAFLRSSTQFKYSFFENFQSIFYIGNLSYISLHSLYEMTSAGQHAVQHFMKELKIFSTKNFWTLINSAEVLSEKFQKYFSGFSPLDKFCFFKRNPTIFSLNSDGYVSCPVDPIVFSEVEAEVVNALVKQLKKSQPMHFKKLCLSAGKSSKVSEKFFQPYLRSQKYRFFKSKPKHFFINSSCFVSIPPSSDAFNENTVPQSVSRSDNFLVNETDESNMFIPDAGLVFQNSNLNGNFTFNSNIEGSAKLGCRFSFHEDTVYRKNQCNSIQNLIVPDKNPELKTLVSSNSYILSKDELNEENEVIEILTCVLKNRRTIHIDELCNSINETITNYFKSLHSNLRFQFFKNRRTKFSIGPQGYVSLSKDLVISKKRSMSTCASLISKSNVNATSSISTKDAAVHNSNFNVTGDKTFAHKQKRQKLGNVNDSVSNLRISGNDFATEMDSSESNNIMPPNQQTSSVIPICKSGINCAAVLGLQNSQSGSMRKYKELLKRFFRDHQLEIIGTLVDQLKKLKHVDFLDLLQGCKELNFTVRTFFRSFSIDEKLNFFKSYPQYFCVDNNLISISNGMQSYLKASTSSKELIKCAVCSNIHNSATIQFESVENLHNPGREGNVTSNSEMGVNAAAHVSSAEETVANTETDFMDIHRYSAFTLLARYQCEIIKTLLTLLKISKHLHFLKLCKSAKELNKVCKHFFKSCSSTWHLEFLKSYPQYFSVDDDNFVTLSNAAQTFSAFYLPCTKLSKSNIFYSNNHDITNIQSQDVANHNDTSTVEQSIIPSHNEKSSNYDLLLNSTKANHCTVPSTRSSANEIVSQDSNTKELLSFFQTALCGVQILHYEELFKMLEDSNKFANYRTLGKKSSMLKFFEDHPNIFTIHSKGYISLIPETDAGFAEIKDSSVTSTCEETVLVPNSMVEMSDNHVSGHKVLCLSPDHLSCIRYSIQALQEHECIHYEKLAKYVYAKHPDVRSFLLLFQSDLDSSDLLDFFKLHSIFLVSVGNVSLRNSNIASDEVLSTEEELEDLKSSLISKTIDFFMSVLKSEESLLIEELENELQYAPGHVNSFINVNYPGIKIRNFFKEHPKYFLLDEHGQLTIRKQ